MGDDLDRQHLRATTAPTRNKVVVITDQLSATTAGAVAGEPFTTVLGPTYGTAYRGVAFVN